MGNGPSRLYGVLNIVNHPVLLITVCDGNVGLMAKILPDLSLGTTRPRASSLLAGCLESRICAADGQHL